MTPLRLYRGATALGEPLIRAYLGHRSRHGREDPARAGERLGIASVARPEGQLVWLHAASVGEALSMLTLIEWLAARRPDLMLLVTTGTVTSAEIMARRLPAGAIHQYVPVDRTAWVRRFLNHWRPAFVLWVESEFWPNLLNEVAARDIPMVLVNARISARSHKGWKRWPRTIERLLHSFDLCLAQSAADRDKLLDLGARNVKFLGNLKFAAEALPADPQALAALKDEMGARPRWLAASTHPGEEDSIAEAHRRLRADRPELLTVIVPRHPARGAEIAEDLRTRGFRARLRSAEEAIDGETDIYIADSVGELGLFYRVCPVTFVGGSLVKHGGQNLLEPARLGCAILHGPYMYNFQAIVDDMRKAGAAAEVPDAAGLAGAVGALLDDAALLQARAAAAAGVAKAQSGILDAVMGEIAPLLHCAAPPKSEDGKMTADHAARA